MKTWNKFLAVLAAVGISMSVYLTGESGVAGLFTASLTVLMVLAGLFVEIENLSSKGKRKFKFGVLSDKNIDIQEVVMWGGIVIASFTVFIARQFIAVLSLVALAVVLIRLGVKDRKLDEDIVLFNSIIGLMAAGWFILAYFLPVVLKIALMFIGARFVWAVTPLNTRNKIVSHDGGKTMEVR